MSNMPEKRYADNTWEQFGKTNPYYGVCTDEKYKTTNLNDAALSEFFETGYTHVNHVHQVLNTILPDKRAGFNSVLDFGCGTGRLVIPFSKISNHVTGVDISGSMLQEARANAEKFGLSNIELIESGSLSVLEGREFDLVHSFIVLQHIPADAGYKLIESLISLIKKGGCGMIHITYSNEKSFTGNIKAGLRSKYKPVAQFLNIIKGKHPNTPYMQMNNYNLAKVFGIMESFGIQQFFVELTNHGGFRGACIYISK